MTATMAVVGAIVTAWSLTGTEPPRVYTWTIGLALVISLFRHRETLNPDAFTALKW